VLLVKDVTRKTWGWEWLESAVQDLKYALRRLVMSPGFTIEAIATLALGIGANTAIFELLDAVLLQSLPVANPQELAEVRIVDMDKARGSFSSAYPVVNNQIWEKLREDHRGFSAIAAPKPMLSPATFSATS
jgi:putative ABC transport system permease protein